MPRTKQTARKDVGGKAHAKHTSRRVAETDETSHVDNTLQERIEELEKKVEEIVKELAELKALAAKSKAIVSKEEAEESKVEVTEAEEKEEKTKSKKTKEVVVAPKKPSSDLTSDAVKKMIKKDLIEALEKRSVPHKKADKVDYLKALLIDYIETSSKKAKKEEKKAKKEEVKEEKKPKAEVKKGKKVQEPEEKADESEKTIEDVVIQLKPKDLERGYATDKHNFVYTLDKSPLVIARFDDDDELQPLSSSDVKELKKLKIQYSKIKELSDIKKELKPVKPSKKVQEIYESEEEKAVESANETEKTYADERAEGEEHITESKGTEDDEDFVKGSFDEVTDDDVTKSAFDKFSLAFENKDFTMSDGIDEIADIVGLEPKIAGRLVTRYALFVEKWPRKTKDMVLAEEKPKEKKLPPKTGRVLFKKPTGAKK